MHNPKRLRCVLIALCLWCANTLLAQTDSLIMAKADTVNFSPNKSEGWKMYNSYVAKTGADSVQLEVVLMHAKDIDFSTAQSIGKIKAPDFWPKNDRQVVYKLAAMEFLIGIDKKGKCTLKLTRGSLPDGNKVILPVKISYKK
jgi:hypothetical protein